MNLNWSRAFALLFLLLTSPLAAQPTRELRGQVFHLGENGEKVLESGLIVTLVETGATDDTNDQGIFRLPLPPAFQPGDTITVSVDKPGWRIRYPMDGGARIPRNLPREVLRVELLQVGSKLFWTNDRIEKFIRDASERSMQESRRQGDAPSLDLGRDIKDWAAKYGFSAQEARDEIDRWIADVEAAHENSYQKGLAAFAKQQFDSAAERFRDSAEWRIRQLDETRRHQEKLSEKAGRLQDEVVRDLRLEGNSHYYVYRYEQALAVFKRAHHYTSKDRTPRLWGATLIDIGRAYRELGTNGETADSPAHLAAAVRAFRQALLVFTREHLPQDWARTQNHLGWALMFQGENAPGEESAHLLAQAVEAQRQALLVFTREQQPQQWAGIQSNLGEALREQGKRTSGEEGTQLLAQAVQAQRQALFVYTREQLPRQWANTQVSLGSVLREQGRRTSGEDGVQLLAQAAQAQQQALLVYTREQLPQDWGRTQNNLGNTLSEQGERTPGQEGVQLLAQAVQAYRLALLVRTREQLPQVWAMTQCNLGLALAEQGKRTPGEEGAQLLAQAVQAAREALLVYTREQLPQHWATTQINLGLALTAQGMRTAGEEGALLLAQAVQAHREALLINTREQLPEPWAMTQINLCNALQEQGRRASYEAGAQHLGQALDACRQALLVLTSSHSSQLWAEARTNEAGALLALHRHQEATEVLSQVLTQELDVNFRIVALGYAIAASLTMNSFDVPDRIEELFDVVAAQPEDFSISWTFEGMLHSLERDSGFPHKDLLVRLFQALKSPDRDSLLEGLKELRNAIPLEEAKAGM